MHSIPGLYYSNTKNRGRGVFCTNDINKGDSIEICPTIIFSEQDLISIHKTKLHDFYFLWGKDQKSGAIALGYGSLYNHSLEPNAIFEMDF